MSNPYTRQVSNVPAGIDQVHSIVFWSKNYESFLKNGYGERLVEGGYHLFFNFTINSDHRLLEPGLPPLARRLDQLSRLCRLFGAKTIHWRFDPICTLKTEKGEMIDNMDDFATIAEHAARSGIRVCISSFADLYRKIERRMRANHPELTLIDPSMDDKINRVMEMDRLLRKSGIQLHLCCEKDVLAALPPETDVRAASCIPNDRLIDLYGPGISLRRDSGQRAAAGCGCRVSRDIGSYDKHPCHHNCLYCYANPAHDGDATAHEIENRHHCAG